MAEQIHGEIPEEAVRFWDQLSLLDDFYDESERAQASLEEIDRHTLLLMGDFLVNGGAIPQTENRFNRSYLEDEFEPRDVIQVLHHRIVLDNAHDRMMDKRSMLAAILNETFLGDGVLHPDHPEYRGDRDDLLKIFVRGRIADSLPSAPEIAEGRLLYATPEVMPYWLDHDEALSYPLDTMVVFSRQGIVPVETFGFGKRLEVELRPPVAGLDPPVLAEDMRAVQPVVDVAVPEEMRRVTEIDDYRRQPRP